MDGVVDLGYWALVGLVQRLLRGGLGVGVGSVVEQLLLLLLVGRHVADDRGGLLATTRVELRVVQLERGGRGTPDRGQGHRGDGPAGSLLQDPANFNVVQLC